MPGANCPSCQQDIGILSVFFAPSPTRIRCPHCSTRLCYTGVRGLLWILAFAAAVTFGCSYALLDLLAIESSALRFLAFVALFIVVWAPIELAIAFYLRKNKTLESVPRRLTMGSKRIKQLIIGLVIIAVAIAAKTFLIAHYRIPQNGMYPGLPAGSGLWLYKRAYSAPTQVKRGDIVVFTHLQNGQPYVYIWRVIGLPGDTIIAAGESLIVNGRPVLRERMREEDGAVIFGEKIDEATFEVAFAQTAKQRPPDASLTVPPNHFFVMGDNRLTAYDSRYFGPISFDSIIGKKL